MVHYDPLDNPTNPGEMITAQVFLRVYEQEVYHLVHPDF